MVLTEPELGVAWLLGTEPADRALAGWSPSAFVSAYYGPLLREHGRSVPLHPGITLAGPLRACSGGHDPVTWYGDSTACWCCPGAAC
jgi:hypothetical protein